LLGATIAELVALGYDARLQLAARGIALTVGEAPTVRRRDQT
jgi:hypothetical protein